MASASSSSRIRLIAIRSPALTPPSRSIASPPQRSLSTTATHSNSSNSSSSHSSSPSTSSASDTEPLTGSSKLLADAIRLEESESAILSTKSRQPDPTDPIWTGEERVQDTILRMVMDKYKPLRLPHDPEKNPADEKIKAGIQTPTSSSPSPTTSSSGDGEEAFQLFAEPGTSGDHEDGRKLPKTPDAKPWRAVYVRPAHLMGGKAAEEFQPSIYYGQFLQSSSSSAPRESDIRTSLKSVGINPSTIPVDDPKALAKLRSSIATAQRRGKLLRARESVLDYQLSLPRKDEMKGDEVSDVSSNLQLQLGHAQGWDSVIEKRIKQALSSPGFRENKLRGKPIQRDMEEKNPFLAREEYFMNRIVKRQGAAPAWVELNMELESEVSGWKGRLDEGWIRRASRMITTSSTLADGLEAFPLDTTIEPSDKDSGKWIDGKQILLPHPTTPGSQRLLDVASRYRDAEWEARETSYHQIELKRLNDLIRKHNHLAPFTARKGLMVLDIELANMYARTLPKLVFEISSILRSKTLGEGRRKDGWDEMLTREGGVVEYDVWGREVRKETGGKGGTVGKGWLDGWLGSGVGSRSGDAVGEGGQGGRAMDSGKEVEVQNLGLLAAIQKSLHWARQRIVGA